MHYKTIVKCVILRKTCLTFPTAIFIQYLGQSEKPTVGTVLFFRAQGI